MHRRHIALLKNTSRTFALPILQAPVSLRDAIGTAYLCMRAIDEIEDHPRLDKALKYGLLKHISRHLRIAREVADLHALTPLLEAHRQTLQSVSFELPAIAGAVPGPVRPLVWQATAEMAEEMADWVERGWQINSEEDLDAYTFTVAGRVGLLLSNLWKWHDGTRCDWEESIAFGRALQAVNIVRNRNDDLSRGVDFYPPDWDNNAMIAYARRQIESAHNYMEKLPAGGDVHCFCKIPLSLAIATLDAIEDGKKKLTRPEVHALLASLNRTEN